MLKVCNELKIKPNKNTLEPHNWNELGPLIISTDKIAHYVRF